MSRPPRSRKSPLRGFLRETTQGFNRADMRRLFDRDAARAYDVLVRDQPERPKARGPGRFWQRAQMLILGISHQLTPARRAVFGTALICAFLGLMQIRFDVARQGTRINIESSPLLFLFALGGVTFLLAVELVDRIAVRDELQVARQLQSELLPHTAPALPGYRIAHSYRTANEIGGDYHNFVLLPDGRLALMAGDASGHGMAAGLLMAIANATLLTALDIDPAPDRVVALLNRMLWRTGDRRAFMTLFYALLEPRTGRLEYLCAGHPFPLLRRADGRIEELGTGALPLGLRERWQGTPASATLQPGDLLLLYTDGLPEALGPQRTPGDRPAEHGAFGFERIAELLARGGSATTVHDRVLAAFDGHLRGEPLEDDLTLVALERTVPAGDSDSSPAA